MAALELYDTTLRDGAQSEGISFSTEDKLRITRRMDEFGVHYIEGGWPGSNPKDIEFFEQAKDLPLKHAKLAAFGSTRKPEISAEEDANLQAILDSGVKVATIFGKSWDFHVTNALNTTLEENLRMIRDSVAWLTARGLEVIYDAEHFFDGYRQNPDYALKTVEVAHEAGAAMVVLCDTNGGSLPGQVAEAVKLVKSRLGCPLGIHAHNDSELAVANTLSAVEAGAVHIQGTVNGYGERCGNANLCSVIPLLQVRMGRELITGEQLASLTEVARFVSETANLEPRPHQPFVGRSAFAHKGGIHVSALMQHLETYEHIDPETVGNHRRVLVSELAGASNIVYKAQEYGIDLSKGSSGTRKILESLKGLEYQGYYFEGAEASFELLVKKSLGLHRPLFDLASLRLIIEKREHNGAPVAEAAIKVRVGDQVVHTVAEGEGPVNALDNALRRALGEAYPRLKEIKLSDYKVRVLDEKSGTAARVRVLITSRDQQGEWGTVGVSTNIIEASWRALVDSIEYGLLKAGRTAEPVAELNI